jgi:ABC-type transport system involved in multi-copper enzyme maturation permease subunit
MSRDHDRAFGALFRKELLEGFVTKRFFAVLVLCLIVFPIGSFISRRDYRARLQNYQEAVRLYEGTQKTVDDVLNLGGAKGFRAPSPFSFLSMGLEIVLPDAAETAAQSEASFTGMRVRNTQSLDGLYEFFHGPLDFSFLVTVVMTFLALAFTYNAVSGERESGTLSLMLASAVPRSRIITAKAAAQFLMLAVPFLAGVALSLILVPPDAGPGAAPAGSAVGTAIVFSLLLIAAFFNLGLLVSSLTRQTVTSIVVLLLAWTAMFAVVPRLSVIAARIIAPAPSEQAFALEVSRLEQANAKACEAEVDQLAKEYPKDSRGASGGRRGYEFPEEFSERQKAIRVRYRSDLAAETRKAQQDYERKRDAQIGLSMRLARVSPMSCYVRSMAEIAGTGWLEYERFTDTVARFQQTLNDEIYGKIRYQRMGSSATIGFDGAKKDPAPRMAEVRVPFDDVARNVLPDFVLLLLFNALFFAGAFVAFLRCDPR